MATETLAGRLYGDTYETLKSIGLSTEEKSIGTLIYGEFDRIEQVENWDGNGTWSYYWKAGKAFRWDPASNIFSECSPDAYERKLEQIAAHKAYWKSLHEGPVQWANASVATLEGWGLNNPDKKLFHREETGEYMGHGTSETCAHSSNDPYGPVYRLAPLTGVTMFFLGTLQVRYNDPEFDSYYEVRVGGEEQPRYMRVNEPFSFEQSVKMVPVEEVPHQFPKED